VPTPRPITSGLFVLEDGTARLLASRCTQCSGLQFPADTTCPYCGEVDVTQERLGPSARLFLHTTVETPPPGYRGQIPYGFGVVELPEGLRIITRFTESDPKRLRPGASMHLVIEPLYTDDDGTPVLSYAFAPTGDLTPA
jgi:uncharacterized OB-fold protein